MRDGNPANDQNWALVCSACGAEYAMNETVDLMQGHWQTEHPDMADQPPAFNLIWKGKGPAPKNPRHHPGVRRRRRR